MPVKKDRFDQLIQAVREVADRERVLRYSKEGSEAQLQIALSSFRKHSPYKTGATFMTTGHDHTPIRLGWDNEPVRATAGGSQFKVINRSPHLQMQRFGTEKKNYQIPLEPGVRNLEFWIGPPLRWPLINPNLSPGFIQIPLVTHPGYGPWGGGDFVKKALDESRPRLQQQLTKTRERVVIPLRRFFG